MGNVNKNSLSAVISEFTTALESYVLTPTEALASSPANFINLLASSFGKLSAYTFYNMLMSKREVNTSTAILTKNLLRHLQSDDLSSIYGTPSTITFILSYPEDDLIKNAILTDTGKYKLTINKGTIFTIAKDKPEFTLDWNIDIYISKYLSGGETKTSIYAVYNTDDLEVGDIFSLSNAFVTTRNDVVVNGVKHFAMFIPVKQYTRTVTSVALSGENKDTTVGFSNNLIGFTVLYKGPSATSYQKVNAVLDGEQTTTGINYSVTDVNGTKSIRLRFSKLPDAFSPTNGTLKIVTYTTEGTDGNFKLDIDDDSDTALEDLAVTFNQDISDEYQEAIITITPTGSLKDTNATGGKDALTIEEIRDIVINGNDDSTIVTPTELNTAALKLGYTSYKARHDLLSFEYRLSSFLEDSDSYIIPTKMINAFYLYSQIALNSETSSRMITPADIFRYDSATKDYEFISADDADAYTDYLTRYENDTAMDYSFPYFIRIQTGSSIKVAPYDLSINSSRSTNFTYLSSTILDKTSVLSANFLRNPLDFTAKTNNVNVTKALKDFYKVSFDVTTSSAIISHLSALASSDVPYVKFKIVLKNTTDSTKYIVDVNLSDCTLDAENSVIGCVAYIETNNYMLSTGKIALINNSITKLPYTSTPYSFYFIDGTLDVEIVVCFKDTSTAGTLPTSNYDTYLTTQEAKDRYYIGVIYSIDDVVIAKSVADNVSLTPDLKLSQPTYKIASADIPDTYASNVYKTKADGSYEFADTLMELADGTSSTTKTTVILHAAGDTKKEADGRVGSYNISTSAWSSETDGTGVYNNGDVLGQVAIYAILQYNKLVIFAGEDGRVGCYDTKTSTWYNYNSTVIYRQNVDGNLPVIRSDGSALGSSAIRGMLIVQVKDSAGIEQDVLVIYGDDGRVASCDLSSNTWRKYNNDGGNKIACIYNNGSSMGKSNIYSAISYTSDSDRTVIVFGGGDGRVCSLSVEDNAWYDYDYSKSVSNNEFAFSNGATQNYKAILTMTKYLDSIVYMAGIDGRVSTLDLSTGTFAVMTDGSVIGNVPIYACAVVNGILCIAGKGGYVASYNLSKSVWNTYDQESGLASAGSHVNHGNIYAIIAYDVSIMFGTENGLVSSYNLLENSWTLYSATSGLRNDGDFILNTISAIAFDSTAGSVIYFAGRAGNIVYKYKKGDTMLDATGAPIVEKASENIGYVKNIPAYDRIYAVKSSYFNILESYENLITNVSTLSTRFPDGCSLFIGLKTTSGASSTFKFTNTKTKVETYLDSLALSFAFGVKFEDNVTADNATYLVATIKEKIVEYIQDLQSSTTSVIRFNIYKMLDAIKDDVPSVEDFEFYTINDYDSTVCQTITCDRTTSSSVNTEEVNEYLSVKSSVNTAKSDVSAREIVFEPAITITVLS